MKRGLSVSWTHRQVQGSKQIWIQLITLINWFWILDYNKLLCVRIIYSANCYKYILVERFVRAYDPTLTWQCTSVPYQEGIPFNESDLMHNIYNTTITTHFRRFSEHATTPPEERWRFCITYNKCKYTGNINYLFAVLNRMKKKKRITFQSGLNYV